MEERQGTLRSRVPCYALPSRPHNSSRRRRNWQSTLKAAAACCITVLLLTTAALFSTVTDLREGVPSVQKGWVQPPAALVVSPWMDRSHILGRITPYAVQNQRNSATHELQESDDLARIRHMIEALSGEHQVLNSAQKPITEFCMYSERNSGSNWVSSLIQANFRLDYLPAKCPHKHDLGMSMPNEFTFLPADVLVVAVFRNAFDWAASMHRHPWHAPNHCNTSSFGEFLLREWSPGSLAGRPNLLHGKPFCPKYDTNTTRMPMIYESVGGLYATNMLELRAWKAARAMEICQTRRQSICVRHEDLIENATTWLLDFQKQYNLKIKPGFPIEVVDYKGVKGREKFIPYSEYNTMRFGTGKSAYYNDVTMKIMREHLDMPLETSLGYFYTDIFRRWLADKPELHFQLPEALRVVQDTTAAADIDEDDSRVGLYSGAAQTTGGGRKIMQPVA